jgi:hypothetical protein
MGLVGCVLLLLFEQPFAAWAATILFGILNALQDHAIVLIPLVVGESKAGAGYGLYGLLGNLSGAIITAGAGMVLGMDGLDEFLLFSIALMAAAIFSWLGVYFLERKRSFVELPTSEIVTTSTISLHVASLMHVMFGHREEAKEFDDGETNENDPMTRN